MSLTPLLFEGREITRGKCGRCGTPNKEQYLWCDACEDRVKRVASNEWIEAPIEDTPPLTVGGEE